MIVVCLANGPSLCQRDVDACRGRGLVIAIKDAVRLAPWADVLYACDAKWWLAHPETAGFSGRKFGLEIARGHPDVTVLRNTGEMGLETAADGLRTGKNSGYQVINLAVHLGATRIVLLGYDMHQDQKGQHHWFGWHAYGRTVPPYAQFLSLFPTLLKPLETLKIEVLNATPGSALSCFPQVTLAAALRGDQVAA